MYIKSMVIDGFKSYGQRTEINGFDSMFNAITGLNGSGKSNILDAICFLLGITNLSHVRATNLQELVYKSGQAGVTKATVTVTFDNRDKKQSPIGYEHYDEVTVTRQVVVGGKNKYLINGSNVQNNRVQDFFRSVQLNVNNPHFLIMQGRITKVLNMKPPEILAMIEEAAGTRMYEAKKQQAVKTIEKKDEKIKEINDILAEEVTPTLNRLREERSQYLQYQKTERELEHLNRQHVAFKFVSVEKASAALLDECRQLQEERRRRADADLALRADMERLDAEVADLQRRRDGESGQQLAQLEQELKGQEKAESKAQSAVKVLKEQLKCEQKKAKELRKGVQDDAAALAAKEAEQARLGDTFEKLRGEERRDADALQAAQKRFQQVSAGLLSSDNEQGATTLADELMTRQKSVAQAESQLQTCEMSLQHLRQQLKAKTNEMNQTEKDYRNDAQASKHLENDVTKLEAELGRLTYDEDQALHLEQERKELEAQVRGLRETIESLEARHPQLHFRYTAPDKQFQRASVKGVVCNLFHVEDVVYATALEVTAGGRLYNVVVDTEATAKKLLERGQLQTRCTFIPLNKIEGRSIDDRTAAAAQRLAGGADRCRTALSLVGYEADLLPAMRYIFGGSFVCRDLEEARRVTFDKQILRKTVTLDGDVVDPAGTMSGGSRNAGASLLTKLVELHRQRAELDAKEQRLAAVRRQEQQLEKSAGQYRELKQRLDVKRHELQLLRQRLEQTAHHRQVQQVDAMKAELDALLATQKECAAVVKDGRVRIVELERQVKNAAQIRDQQLKEAQKELERCQKKAAASQAKWKEQADDADALKLEIEELAKSIETTKNQLQETEASVVQLTEQQAALEAELEAERRRVEDVRQRIETAKAALTAQNQEIARRVRDKERKEQELEEGQLAAKKLEHRVVKAEEEAKDSERRVQAMLEKHGWIAEDRHLFGVANSNYDFAAVDGNELGRRVAKLQESMQKLGRHVNVRSMTMLTQAEGQYNDLMRKKRIVEDDKAKIENAIVNLDQKKAETLQVAWERVNKDFGSIFATLLPGTSAKLQPPAGQSVLDGLEVKVAFGGVWKDSLQELSGGQRSLVALSLILAMLLFKPAPIYILDEVDAALDLSHTQNIGVMLKQHFKQSQFIVVSLKDGMFNNANVLFRTKFVEGMSTVSRLAQQQQQLAVSSATNRQAEADEQRQIKRKK